MTIDLTLNPEAATAVGYVMFGVVFYAAIHLVRYLFTLRSQRRRDALFEHMAHKAMESGRPITFSNDTIKRS